MVAIDNQMRPIPIPQYVPQNEQQEKIWKQAKAIREDLLKAKSY